MPTIANHSAQCPHCGVELFAAFSAGKAPKPKPGHWAICTKCAGICRFGDDLIILKVSAKDLQMFMETNPFQYDQLMSMQKSLQKE